MVTEQLDPITLLSRDLRVAARSLSDREARYLVDYYYITQEDRKRANLQVKALGENEEPHSVLVWLFDNTRRLEGNIKAALEIYAREHPVGRWSMSLVGIGPVISAGLLANIEMDKTPSSSALWSFAGQDPTKAWEKGQKRPWNASLKTLCWKIGESFVKTCNHKDSFYGPVYRQAKEVEEERNSRGFYADQAREILTKKRLGEDTEARKHYEEGRLPPAHIHARAKRKAVKLFLSHWWEVAYEVHYGEPPQIKPYVFDHLGHQHYIPPPGWPV